MTFPKVSPIALFALVASSTALSRDSLAFAMAWLCSLALGEMKKARRYLRGEGAMGF